MKRLIAFVLFAAVFVGGVSWAQEKKKEEIIWVHLNWVARNGNAKGCVQTTTTKSDTDNNAKANALIEILMGKAQEACARAEKAKAGACPRGEAMGHGELNGLGTGACL